MVAEGRHAAHTLMERLAARPEEFGFFQAVRRLDCAHPDMPGTGRSVRPKDDPVRFGQPPSLAFAPRTLDGLDLPTETQPPRLRVNCFGLLGPNGPMPLYITEYARSRSLQHGDKTLVRFLDVFNHRMTSLFYRAWADNNPAVSYERGERGRFAAYFASFCGLGMESLRNRDAVPDEAKLYFSGHLGVQTRHAEGLRAILEQYFGVPAAIETFVGQWIELDGASRLCLGGSPETGTLGRNAVVGGRVWGCQHRFRVRLGPMSLADYARLLPDRAGFGRLRTWVRNYVGDELFWDVQMALKAGEIPDVQLGRRGQLGWTTWLRSRPAESDAADAVFTPDTYDALTGGATRAGRAGGGA